LEILNKNNGLLTSSLNKAQINKIYKKLAGKANVDKEILKKISGHSTRVGAAQNLLSSGANLGMILKKGRWTKIDTAMKYLENSNELIDFSYLFSFKRNPHLRGFLLLSVFTFFIT
jgi:hypothetical protein